MLEEYGAVVGHATLGRGEHGSRMDWVFETCLKIFVYIPAMMLFLSQAVRSSANVLHKSIYVRLGSTVFMAAIFVAAFCAEYIFFPARAILNSKEGTPMDVLSSAKLTNALDSIAKKLITSPEYLIAGFRRDPDVDMLCLEEFRGGIPGWLEHERKRCARQPTAQPTGPIKAEDRNPDTLQRVVRTAMLEFLNDAEYEAKYGSLVREMMTSMGHAILTVNRRSCSEDLERTASGEYACPAGAHAPSQQTRKQQSVARSTAPVSDAAERTFADTKYCIVCAP